MSATNSLPTTPAKGVQNQNQQNQIVFQSPTKRINQPTSISSPTLVKKNEITPGISRYEFFRRRNAIFQTMKNKSILILPSGPQKYMSPDIVYKYRQNPDFLYLTGFQEPSCVLCLYKQDKDNQYFYLFVTEYDPKTVTYEGHVAGTEAAKIVFKANETYDLSKMDKILKPMIEKCCTVYFNPLPKKLDAKTINFTDILMTERIQDIIDKCKNIKKSNLKKIGTMIGKLRIIKSEQEIGLMKESGKIASISMKEMIQSVTPGIIEDRLAAMFEFGCRMRGAARLSAPVTISHGDENNILHYLNNDRSIKDGTLALMDTGCEYFGYCSDITRVFPTNGKYSDAQLKIYNLVLKVQKTCIEKLCVVGASIKKLDIESGKLLKEGLQKLDILIKTNDTKIEEMWHSGGVHFVSHWIGMDIHDTNDIGHKTKFQHGMCIAVEPGIYLPHHESIKPEYRNIGIRIEDTVLITNDGPQVLTNMCPKDPYEIMELMKEDSKSQQLDQFRDAKEGLWSPKTKKQIRAKLFDNISFW